MIVNLNVMCKVKLNELGKQVWLHQIEDIPEDIRNQHPEVVKHIKDAIDENNCIQMQLWMIMNLFGKYITDVKSPFASTTIEINKNPDFGNYFKKENK